jgi:hypothetical protein
MPPHDVSSYCLSGAAEPRTYTFLSSLAGPRTDRDFGGGQKISPRAVGGAQHRCRGGGSKRGSPRAGLVGPLGEESQVWSKM